MNKFRKRVCLIGIPIAAIIALYLASLFNFLFFHSISEIFCIIISCVMAIETLNSVRFTKKEFDYITYIGVANIFIAFLITLHLLSYKNMPLFGEGKYNANEFILAANYLQAISFLLPFLFIKYKKKLKPYLFIILYFIITVILIELIFGLKIFPICYIENKGQTTFKIISEAIICFILLVAGILIKKNKNTFNHKVYLYLCWSMIIFIVSLFPLSIYKYSFSTINFVGHILKMISFYILYEAVNVICIDAPNKRAKSELEERKRALNKYKNLFNSIDEGFSIIELVYDLDGKPIDYRYVEMNPAFVKHTGIENAIGRRASEITPIQAKSLVQVYNKVSLTGKPIRFVFESTELKNWYSLYAFRIDIEDSSKVAVLFCNINDEVKARNEMENNIRMQEEIFANVSHELKTPLNVIFSTVQLLDLYLKNNSLDSNKSRVSNNIDIIKQNCYRFTKLINNIVDLSKMDSGFMKYNMKNGNIIEVVENIVQSISEFVHEKELNIIFDTDVEEKIIAFDADKIERVMLNLISNAIKFSNSGDIIYIDIFDKTDFVEICVRDTGVGIEKKNLKSIFERFNQVDKTLSRNAEGTGIGLSLVKSIIDMHGGKIYVDSELGKGSTFSIELPVRLIECSDDEQVNVGNDKIEMINIEFSDIYNLKCSDINL